MMEDNKVGRYSEISEEYKFVYDNNNNNNNTNNNNSNKGSRSGSLVSILNDYAVHQVTSYDHHMKAIDAFLLEKTQMRGDWVYKTRDVFGPYKDCCSVVKKPIYFGENEKGMLTVRYSATGDHIVGGFGSGTIKLFNAKSQTEERTVIFGKENGYAITCVRFITNSDDVFYASTAEGFLMRYDIPKDDLSIVINQTSNEINAIDINSTNQNLVSGGSSHDIKVYDINNYMLLSSFKNGLGPDGYEVADYHTNRVHAVKFLPDDPNMFLSGGWDNKVKLWDLREKGGCTVTMEGPHISGDSIDVKDNLLLTGSWEPKNSLYLWDLRTHTLISNINPVNAPKIIEGVYTFSSCFYDGDPTGDLILRASLCTKSVDVISIRENVILESFLSEQSCITCDSHGIHIAFGGAHNVLSFVAFFTNLLYDPVDRPLIERQTTTVDDEELEEEEQSQIDDFIND